MKWKIFAAETVQRGLSWELRRVLCLAGTINVNSF